MNNMNSTRSESSVLSNTTTTTTTTASIGTSLTIPDGTINQDQSTPNLDSSITNNTMASPTQISPTGATNSSANLGSTAAPKTGTSSDTTTQILTKPRLQELVREIDPTEQLDEEVEEILLQIADDFVENTVNAACLIAKHRKVPKVEIRDVQLHLERNWNMWIPGFGTDELRPYKRATVTEAHKQRLALIRKAIKKY